MSLSQSDRQLITAELGRDLTAAEAALFENLWSEHCAYRSSRPLLRSFDAEGEDVIVGPGDDAAVVRIGGGVAIAIGIESHNHPSYVDPYDGAATGVGGIVRDIMSMGAYPIALADCLYFGDFDDEHSRYLFEGVVEGIADYGNSIGVPTVTGGVEFHPGYEGNPLVNVGCVGLVGEMEFVTAAAQSPGNALVLVGNATGRDGLGGASFASEDLAEDAETEDRPAVQVGDPYTEKLLIEANLALLDADIIVSARDLGAAGLGGATSEMAAKGGLGARIELDAVHQREPNMTALEILIAESQERMCYEVKPDEVADVHAVADRYDLGCSVVGEVTDDRYVCTFEGEVVVDVPAEFLGEGAPMNDLPVESPAAPEPALPDVLLGDAFDAVVGSPNTASKEWVYRQYDHEVGVRTSVPPGDDAAILAVREAGIGLALSAGANPAWTSVAPHDGARAIALENATNLAAKGASPCAAVDCLNGGNPEKPAVYGGFSAIVTGLAEMCQTLSIPVVGGNVSLYNDSSAGPIPPTPTVFMVGTKDDYAAPSAAFTGGGDLLVIGDAPTGLGGSEYLAQTNGRDRFPALPETPAALIDRIAAVANHPASLAVHDVSHGGLATTLAEMVTADAGAVITLHQSGGPGTRLFSEAPGRVVVETTDAEAIREVAADTAPVTDIGHTTNEGQLSLEIGEEQLDYSFEEIVALRGVIERELG